MLGLKAMLESTECYCSGCEQSPG